MAETEETSSAGLLAEGPAGAVWSGDHLVGREELWRIPFPSEVAAELIHAARSAISGGAWFDIGAAIPAGLSRAEAFATGLHRRLAGARDSSS
ncbi:hypothetical protein G3I77_36150 [Streptomyces sp. D2-8]|uniref:hypothetical protein n=1 Tax=Streptomyces sp. D2-8 TaxID=2707767 RepID=UPI0020BF5802|nr:hypothetical protein [Streptomyces sp. D2-8]MCK8438248.1 hypothetical protein [Streptomyces sp. D2-8]